MKKTTFIVTMILIMSLLTGCGADRGTSTEELQESVKTLTNRVADLEEQVETQKELEEEVKSLKSQMADMETALEKIDNDAKASESNEKTSEKDDSNEKTVKIAAVYRGKVISLKTQTEIEAINNPVSIYEGEMERNITFLISGAAVKDVYVNQTRVEEVTYNAQEGEYVFGYYMNGEGQYTLLIDTDNGQYYASVLY